MRTRSCAARLLLAACLSVMAASCQKSTPVSPDPPLTGTFHGTIVDKVAGPGTLDLHLTQNGAAIAGDWTATFSNAAYNQSGAVRGTALNTSIVLSLTPTVGLNCGSVTFDGTLTVTASLSNARLTGTYVVLTCTSTITGTIDVAKL